MDGFDDISRTHADKTAVILSDLMKSKVATVWVTSHPVQKERLEKELSVISFSMKTLSLEFQEDMFRKLWMSKVGEKKVTSELHTFIKNFLFMLNKSASVLQGHGIV